MGIGALLLLGAVLVAQRPALVWHTVATTVGNIAAQYALYRGWFDGPVAWAEQRLPHYRSFARFVALAVCVVSCVLATMGIHALVEALARG
ncbi:MAG TPA: hypothetical protein VK034_12730 [Enhygromyxa sp.]|nr:hypothetical protein [Enhygromyxa sp.]